MRRPMPWLAVLTLACSSLLAQSSAHDLPPAVLTARTVAIVNNTTDRDLTKGAQQAIAAWGQLQLTQDTDTADITLRFDKVKSHSGDGASTKDQNTGQWSSTYGVTFGSSIHMKAYLKDGDTPIYETKTDDGKTKGGMECVNQFHDAYRTARQQANQPVH